MYSVWKVTHYDDVIRARWRLKTPASRLFTQPFIQAPIKKHQSSASLTFVRGFHRSPVTSPHKWPFTRKYFHSMTPSCAGFFPDQVALDRTVRDNYPKRNKWFEKIFIEYFPAKCHACYTVGGSCHSFIESIGRRFKYSHWVVENMSSVKEPLLSYITNFIYLPPIWRNIPLHMRLRAFLVNILYMVYKNIVTIFRFIHEIN